MNKKQLIEWHERALARARAKNKRTLEKLSADNSSNNLLQWQAAEIEVHKEAIAFLEQLP